METAPAAFAAASEAYGPATLPLFKDHEEVGEIHVPQEQPDRRHDDIRDQGTDDRPKGCSDDDSHCHIHYIPPHGKLFKFFQHLFLPPFSKVDVLHLTNRLYHN